MNPCPVLDSNYRVDAGASAVRAILTQAEIPIVFRAGDDRRPAVAEGDYVFDGLGDATLIVDRNVADQLARGTEVAKDQSDACRSQFGGRTLVER